MSLLKNKNAIVIGGAGDIGIEIVKSFFDHGAKKIVVIDNKDINLNLSNHREVFSISSDINFHDNISKSFSEALSTIDNQLHILVNCAGIQIRHRSDKFPTDDWNRIIQINMSSAFEFMKLASKIMIPKKYGKIINVTSINGVFGGVNIPAYSASKAGLSQLTKSFCNDVAKFGINVNSISPGYIKTSMNNSLLEDSSRVDEISKRIPQNRWGRSSDIAGAAVFLASNLSDYMNGSTITVDGGYSVR